MAEITLQVAGRSYSVSARDEDMPHLRELEARIGSHADAALRAAGGQSGERTLLYLALILADALDEAEKTPAPAQAVPDELLERIADRLEAVASALEESDATS
ncbi:cell division protein ZapA [Sphingomonas sp. ABOLD]|uniref:Cell division protein ZapA n=1 Tax=Sphingomonas trueperi TaxID=53317 RepID=A0A7X5XYV5_9SPHN|nr:MULTISPECIES: cell division protein ZapA [Sphingomonas]NJB97931.1 cell division protein ZapA [Sphingomonas trueperi]RSV34220.1 cell division protein ZapA [Sphingomonas sp. ABOLE]RSV38834.1 cell division protein ZapA [Sphingomonas sp. ABOLD]